MSISQKKLEYNMNKSVNKLHRTLPEAEPSPEPVIIERMDHVNNIRQVIIISHQIIYLAISIPIMVCKL